MKNNNVREQNNHHAAREYRDVGLGLQKVYRDVAYFAAISGLDTFCLQQITIIPGTGVYQEPGLLGVTDGAIATIYFETLRL